MERPYIIGICGGSGSGKTSVIRAIADRFTSDDVCVVSQDDYYRPRTEQKMDDQGFRNFDRPKSILSEELHRDLLSLIDGRTVERAEYTFNNERADPQTLTMHPAPIIVVEGLFVLYFKKIRKLMDLRVFVHAKDNLKIIRRIRRDQLERNYPIDDVLYRYEHHVLPAYEKYILPYREQAHLILNNNEQLDSGLDVLCAYISHRLSTSPA